MMDISDNKISLGLSTSYIKLIFEQEMKNKIPHHQNSYKIT